MLRNNTEVIIEEAIYFVCCSASLIGLIIYFVE